MTCHDTLKVYFNDNQKHDTPSFSFAIQQTIFQLNNEDANREAMMMIMTNTPESRNEKVLSA
jgi:hypothetical protein